MAVDTIGAKGTPEAWLRSFIERFDPKEQRLIRSVRSAVRKRLPTANELVYDYRDFFVISYSPTEHGKDGILAIAARTDGLRLYFGTQGTQLPDPNKMLLGSGKQTRYIRVETVRRLAQPDVEALIAAAIERASIPPPSQGRGKLVLKSGAKKPRPRPKPSQ